MCQSALTKNNLIKISQTDFRTKNVLLPTDIKLTELQ